MSRALNLSFGCNCMLLAVRLGIAVISGSLSLLIATMDAVLDVISSGGCGRGGWLAALGGRSGWLAAVGGRAGGLAPQACRFHCRAPLPAALFFNAKHLVGSARVQRTNQSRRLAGLCPQPCSIIPAGSPRRRTSVSTGSLVD